MQGVVITPSRIQYVKNMILPFLTPSEAKQIQFGKIRAMQELKDNERNVNFKFRANRAESFERKETKLDQNDLFIIVGYSFGFKIDTEYYVHHTEAVTGATGAESTALSQFLDGLLTLKAGTSGNILDNHHVGESRYNIQTVPGDSEYGAHIIYSPLNWVVSGQNALEGLLIANGQPADPTVAAATKTYGVLDLYGFRLKDLSKTADFKQSLLLEEWLSAKAENN